MADDKIAIKLGIAAMAQLGALLRMLLGLLKTPDLHQMSSVQYANCLGCFIIGLVGTMSPLFEKHHLTPLCSALTVGFCGALTTFSTWQYEVARWLVWWPNPDIMTVPGGKAALWPRIVSAFSALLTEICIACAAYRLGVFVASLVLADHEDPTDVEEVRPILSNKLMSGDEPRRRTSTHKYLHGTDEDDEARQLTITGHDRVQRLTFFGLLVVVTLAVAAPVAFGGHHLGVLLAVVLAPIGALLRYALGILLNAYTGGGTLAANMVACVLLAVLTLVSSDSGCFSDSLGVKSLFFGLTFGFCGSLSTTSSFVAQLHGLSPLGALQYGAVSVIGAQLVSCCILGGYLHGHAGAMCS